ncbi:MAG: DUF4446 family protein [Clostridiaceae bacterium]|nr:DUF4446 family protein [Clostridiaceae bacterium]
MITGNINMDIIFGVLFLFILINTILVIVLFKKLSQIRKSQKVLNELFSGESVEELLYKVLEQQEVISNEALEIKKQILHLENKQKYCFDRISLVRYRGPQEDGAKLSYSIGISNENEDGLVITGIHFRNGVNLYFKHVKEGVSDIELSEEEKKVMARTKVSEIYSE